MSSLFFNVNANDGEGRSLFSVDSSVVLGGSADVYLEDGVKSPDFSLYEDNPNISPVSGGWPTVVWEVAYSEREKKLVHDLARYVACSLGSVQLAIGINIEHDSAGGLPVGHPRTLKKVSCEFWEVDYTEIFETLEETGSPLNQLTRCDEYADEAAEYVVPAATMFSCVSEYKGKYVKFVVSQKHLYSGSLFCLILKTLPCANI